MQTLISRTGLGLRLCISHVTLVLWVHDHTCLAELGGNYGGAK